MVIEFRLQCSVNGTWIGFVPDCVPLECPIPNPVDKGRIFFNFENGTNLEIPTQKIDEPEVPNSTIEESKNGEEEINIFDELAAEADKFDSLIEKPKISFVPGSKISIKCNPGYKLIGEETRTCSESEDWSSYDTECKRRRCEIKEHPVIGQLSEELEKNYQEIEDTENIRGKLGNTTFIFEGSYYEDRIVFACEDDTNLDFEGVGASGKSRNLTWRCDEEGEWQLQEIKLDEVNLGTLLKENVEICKPIVCGMLQVREYLVDI